MSPSGPDLSRRTRPGDAHERDAQASAARAAKGESVPPGAAAPRAAENSSGLLNSGGGRPLDEAPRAAMEQALGADLGAVRVHTDSASAARVDSAGARALSSGRDIHFGPGEYAPGTRGGRELLAHELSHTLQPGAAGRVAGWWKDSHRAITQVAGQSFASEGLIDTKIVQWVASKAGSQDETSRSWANFVTSLTASFFAKKHYQRLRSSAREKGELGEWKNPKDRERAESMWDNLGFHLRWPVEKKYHGEAGGYVRDNGETANTGAVDNQIDKAAKAYIGGSYREGLLQLADGLHSAEDRGSHGEGAPYTGHDPRLTMPEKFDGTHNPNYLPGWDCDNPSVNTGGRALAEGYARDGWAAFYDKVKGIKSAKEKLEGGKRGMVQPSGILSKYGTHAFRLVMTPVTEGIAALKQPKESKLKKIGGYDKVKQDNPDPENPTSNPVANMVPIYRARILDSADVLRQSMDQIREAFDAGKSSPGKATYEKLRDTSQEMMQAIQNTPELQPLARLATLLAQLAIKAEEWRRRSSGMHTKSTKQTRNLEILTDLRMFSRRIDQIVDDYAQQQ